MDVSGKLDWVFIPRSELEPGDLFKSTMGNTEILAICASLEGEKYAFVLLVNGSDIDFDRFPPPGLRAMSTIGLKVQKFVGKASAQNKRPKETGIVTPVAITPSGFEHGDLLVDQAKEPWVFALDHATEQGSPDRILVSLKTGNLIYNPQAGQLSKGGGITPDWELIGIAADGAQIILAEYASQ